jgi:hypothetical protein
MSTCFAVMLGGSVRLLLRMEDIQFQISNGLKIHTQIGAYLSTKIVIKCIKLLFMLPTVYNIVLESPVYITC